MFGEELQTSECFDVRSEGEMRDAMDVFEGAGTRQCEMCKRKTRSEELDRMRNV